MAGHSRPKDGVASLAYDPAIPLRDVLCSPKRDHLVTRFARLQPPLLGCHEAEHTEEIEMPPGAAGFAVGGELQAALFLFLDNLLDLTALDLFELGRSDLALGLLGTRLLQRRGPQ